MASKDLFTYSSMHKYNSSYSTSTHVLLMYYQQWAELPVREKRTLLANLPQFHPSGSCHWSEGQHVQGTAARHEAYPCWGGEAVGRGVDTRLFVDLELQSLSNASAWSKGRIEVERFEDGGKERETGREMTTQS